MSLFEGQAPGSIHQLLAMLEGNMALLGDTDQGFVIGCRSHLNEGAILTADNQAQLRRIAATIGDNGVPDMGDGIVAAEQSLSTLQMLRHLAGTIHTLNPEERRFANSMATKHKQKVQMSPDELQKLVTLYTLKGF